MGTPPAKGNGDIESNAARSSAAFKVGAYAQHTNKSQAMASCKPIERIRSPVPKNANNSAAKSQRRLPWLLTCWASFARPFSKKPILRLVQKNPSTAGGPRSARDDGNAMAADEQQLW